VFICETCDGVPTVRQAHPMMKIRKTTKNCLKDIVIYFKRVGAI